MYGYNVRSTSDAQGTAADNSTVIQVTPPNGALGMLISVVTTDVWVTFGNGTPSTSLGHVVKKDQPPWFVAFAAPFKFLPTSNAAAKVNVTYLF